MEHSYLIMDPFNIKINHQGEDITLTVLPQNNYYKIIYFGAIVGAIKQLDTDWELLVEEDIDAGELPFYKYKQSFNNEGTELTLNLPEVNQIAAQIEHVLAKG